MASQNRDQWGRQGAPTQPQQTHSINPYQWSPATLTSEQLAFPSRPYQPTVEDVVDESRTYHNADQGPIFPHTQLPFPNSNITYSSFGDYDYPTSFNMSSRRSTNPFTPPSLCSDGSALSSASSNFSTQSSAPDQQSRRRSSQQAFLEWEAQEALARANKRMATVMPTTPPFCRTSTDVESAWGRAEASYPPNAIGCNPTPHFPLQSPNSTKGHSPHVKTWPLMHEAFSVNPARPSKFSSHERPAQQSSPQLHHRTQTNHQDVRTQPSASPTYKKPRSPTSPADTKTSSQSTPQVSGQFETFLESELHRRSIADKTIGSIRSAQARALAQSKENARRTDWAKEVLLKFPIESAMCESLNPGTMMRAVAADGVFDMSAGLAR